MTDDTTDAVARVRTREAQAFTEHGEIMVPRSDLRALLARLDAARSDLLATLRARVEGMRKAHGTDAMYRAGYNAALADVLAALDTINEEG